MTYVKKLVIKGFKSFARETSMEMDRHVNVIVGPNGSGKSCSYDTLVKLSNGQEIQIGELVEREIKKSKEIKKLDDGVYVNGEGDIKIISLNKDTGKSEEKSVSKFVKREGDILYRIKTRTGKEVKATGCHPVMVFKDEEIKSVVIKDLEKGDLIASPRILDIKGNSFDNDFSRFIGYIIGDGYISDNRIEFVNNDKEIIEDYKLILNKLNLKYSERIDKNAKRIYINNPLFYKKIKDMFIANHKGSVTSGIKKIPDLLLTTNKESISNLLAGLYDTDGSVRKDIAVIEFCTKNQELANQIQGLLLRFGIISKIKKRICCAANTENKIKRDYFYLYIYGIENFEKFYNNISLKVVHKSESIRTWLSKNIKSNPNLDLLPRELNFYVKELSYLLGIKIKPLRKKYPFFAAYTENRCLPTKTGIKKIVGFFKEKLTILQSSLENLKCNQLDLINSMDNLNISGQQASIQIGMNKSVIRNNWQTNKFNARPENLNRFFSMIRGTLETRLPRIKELLSLLYNLANSDIYWDEIVLIEKLEKPEYVYDLTIEDNHNFIANNIFVHNSNITDALCFVLGRLSIKSMRAAKASHLIFSGNKYFKGATEAYVEIILDNEDRAFALENKEIKIRRIVRKNGQSIYRINDETKTRQEVLELLNQAGIDPHGFNIVLQGEIERFVKMPAEDRRKIIEEVAGISVYEMRKAKSLKELERTEEKLSQINTVLRERTNYLKNLENEKEEALKFKKLEETLKKCKASIINKNLQEKQKELNEVLREISIKEKDIGKRQEIINKTQNEINILNEKINNISRIIQKSSGFEQDALIAEISKLKQENAGMIARKENFENQLIELDRRKQTLQESIKQSEKEIEEMSREKGKNKKQDLSEKKQKLEELDELKRQSYLLKSNLSSLNSQIEDKKKQIERLKNESNFILNQIQQTEKELKTKKTQDENQDLLINLKQSIKEIKEQILISEKDLIEKEKLLAVQNQAIIESDKIKTQVSRLDICPLCKTKMTEEHVREILDKSDKDISKAKEIISDSQEKIKQINSKIEQLQSDFNKQNSEINIREIDNVKIQTITEKKQQLRRNDEQINMLEKELKNLEIKENSLETNLSKIKISEEQYENLRLEIDELNRSEERNLGVEITTKQRELERIRLAIKQIIRDKQDISEDLADILENLEGKQEIIQEKEEQAEILKRKYQKMFDEKNTIQDKVRMFETNLMKHQNEKRLVEGDINNLNITRAQITAKKETCEQELAGFGQIEFLSFSIEELREKQQKTEEILSRIGSVNMRALEEYGRVKEAYDKIKEKVDQLEKEKEKILIIISQIDRKKRKVFLDTLQQINELFSRNFSQLSTKGIVSLEPQNPKEIFEAGLDILVKVGAGKYFDVTSLSGGEQTLVALSLIFAIQEFRPYCFYIFDEIDAALDKRNSEKLAYLLKKYMKEGQYLIITHNDSLISEASNVLYGVSMQEGVSRILSLEV